jgi:FtsP/CotA-like multicopper oxidase with cupredoxin domain
MGAGLLLSASGRPLFSATSAAAEMIGPSFDLIVDTLPVHLTGAARTAVAVNGQIPAPTLRMRQGDEVTIRITNKLREQTSIHWHGLIIPADMDGVPGLSFGGIAPGTTFTYRYRVNQSGTYWYHSHSRFQEQVGLYGALVVERRGGERHQADRGMCCCCPTGPITIPNTFTPRSSARATITTSANVPRRISSTTCGHADSRTHSPSGVWSAMRMDATDLADVSGYEYLSNERNEPGR